MKTNHIMLVSLENCVFCKARESVVDFNQLYATNVCTHCPLYNGAAQGKGVECLFEDGSNRAFKAYTDPREAEEELSGGR